MNLLNPEATVLNQTRGGSVPGYKAQGVAVLFGSFYQSSTR